MIFNFFVLKTKEYNSGNFFLIVYITKDKEIGVIEGGHESIVWTLVWHPVGHILTTGSNDHTVKFWSR